MSSTKQFSILNIFALVVVLTVNALANILPINGMNTGQISDLYPSLFTPAGFIFSIWSVIYLLLIVFSIAQFKIQDQLYFKELSMWFLLSCVANVSWILAWHHLYTSASVVIMLILLYSLTRIFLLLNNNQLSKTEIWPVFMPLIGRIFANAFTVNTTTKAKILSVENCFVALIFILDWLMGV